MRAVDIRSWPPGVLNATLFFCFVALGVAYIVIAKLSGLNAVAVTAVPVLIMLGYAALLAMARLVRLRDDQSGDNLYYMGFLFTLTSLAVSLYRFSSDRAADLIVQNFGIAISSTIAGIALRIFFNQMRRDPVEVEGEARKELAEAARKVRRELDGTVLEFSHFRRATQQSITEAIDEVTTALGESKDRIVRQLEDVGRASKRPVDDAGRQFQALLADTSRRVAGTISDLSLSVNNFVRNAELQAKTINDQARTMNDNVAQLKALSAAIIALAKEIKAAQARGDDSPSPGHKDRGRRFWRFWR
jgi:methyl-accepting chemotaxis protein